MTQRLARRRDIDIHHFEAVREQVANDRGASFAAAARDDDTFHPTLVAAMIV